MIDDEWARVVLLNASGTQVATWSLTGEGAPDLGTVDALARLQLAAGRLGWVVTLQAACDELRGLLDLAGLGQVLATTK